MADTEFEKKKERHASGQSTVSSDSVSNYIPTPPDGGYGWVVVFAAFFIHVIVDGITFTFGVFYSSFLETFGESKGKTSLVGSLLGGFYLMICFVASALVNKFGCRPVSMAGSVLSSLGFFLSIFSPNVTVLMLTYGVLGGSGFAMCFFPSVIAVSFYFQKRRALATGIAVCGAGVGGFIMAPFVRYLLDVYAWKNAMLIISGIALNGCVFGALLRPLEPVKKKKRPRAKNVIDRLKEQTKLKRSRQESECSACAHGNHNIMQRIQEVKLARENMLREEDSEYGSEYGSVPNSTLNSVRRLDRAESYTYGYVPSRSGSIQIPRQEALRREAAGANVCGSPTSLGASLPYYGASPPSLGASPVNYATTPQAGSESTSLMSANLPKIIIEGEVLNIEEDECIKIIYASEEDPSQKRLSSTFKTVPEEEEPSNPDSNDNDITTTSDHPLIESPVRTNGHVHVRLASPMTASCPHTNEMCQSMILDSNGYLSGTEQKRSRHHSKSAGEINNMSNKKKKKYQQSTQIRKTDYSRPLYRKDIFYSGSVINVTQFRSQPDVKTYVKSMMSIPEVVMPEQESICCRCLPKSAKDTIREMMDVSLFKEPIFVVAAVGNLFAFIGLFIPFVFISGRAEAMGVSVNHSAFLLSVIGITNMAGRLLAGFLADFKWVNSLLLHNMSLLVAGVACVLNMFSVTYAQMCVYAAVFGLCIATYISLTSIVLCNLLGLERLTNAYGLLCAIRGMASIVGPPIAGAVMDATQNYDVSFHVGGVMMFVSGLIFCILHLRYFQKTSWQNIQNDNVNAVEIEVVFDDDIAAAYQTQLKSNTSPTEEEEEPDNDEEGHITFLALNTDSEPAVKVDQEQV